jgi:hypothetical protein
MNWTFFPAPKLADLIGQDMTRLFRCYAQNHYNAYADIALDAFYVPESSAEALWSDVATLCRFAGVAMNKFFHQINPETWFAKAYDNATTLDQWCRLRDVRCHIISSDPPPEEQKAFDRLYNR